MIHEIRKILSLKSVRILILVLLSTNIAFFVINIYPLKAVAEIYNTTDTDTIQNIHMDLNSNPADVVFSAENEASKGLCIRKNITTG